MASLTSSPSGFGGSNRGSTLGLGVGKGSTLGLRGGLGSQVNISAQQNMQSRMNFVSMMSQYRGRGEAGAEGEASTGDLEKNIVDTAKSRLDAYHAFRSRVDKKYTDQASRIEEKRSSASHGKLEEAQYEIKSLRAKLEGRDRVISELRMQVLQVASAQAVLGGGSHDREQQSAAAAPSFSSSSSSSSSSGGDQSRQDQRMKALEEQRQALIKSQNDEFLAALNQAATLQAQLGRSKEEIARLRDLKQRADEEVTKAYDRFEQREIQIFDRMLSLEVECNRHRQGTKRSETLVATAQNQVDDLTQKYEDAQQRVLDLEGQLQDATMEGEHMAAEVG